MLCCACTPSPAHQSDDDRRGSSAPPILLPQLVHPQRLTILIERGITVLVKNRTGGMSHLSLNN
jgi:hypothetical protein